MKVKFPRGLVFDLNNIPEDFDDQIRQAFREYTEETNKDYRFHDKLLFIDRTVNLLHGGHDNDTLVDDWINGYAEYERKENGYFITGDDVYSWDGLVSMIELGKKQQSLYGEYVERGSHEDEKIMMLLVKVIKAVMNYEE